MRTNGFCTNKEGSQLLLYGSYLVMAAAIGYIVYVLIDGLKTGIYYVVIYDKNSSTPISEIFWINFNASLRYALDLSYRNIMVFISFIVFGGTGFLYKKLGFALSGIAIAILYLIAFFRRIVNTLLIPNRFADQPDDVIREMLLLNWYNLTTDSLVFFLISFFLIYIFFKIQNRASV